MDTNRTQSKYCYPGTDVLINKLSIMDQERLTIAERGYTLRRMGELLDKPIPGNFNLKHLQQIHKYLFQDIYDFAGKIRDVPLQKNQSLFALPQTIESYYSKEVLQPLKNEKYLKGLDVDQFSERAGHYMAETNMVHPFREGNGRAQREFFRTLAMKNGYDLDWDRVDSKRLLAASIRSEWDPKELGKVIRDTIINEQPERAIMKVFEERTLER